MLADYGDDCRAIAGGTALMLALRQRMVNPTRLISLGLLEATRVIACDSMRLSVRGRCRPNSNRAKRFLQQRACAALKHHPT